MDIRIVEDAYGACPRCGAYWGHPNKDLDFPNRCKVDNDWRCYNPNCTCGYYDPERGVVVEDKLSPEAEKAMYEKVKADVEKMFVGKKWETVEVRPGVTRSRLVPE